MKKYIMCLLLIGILSCGKPSVDVEVKGGVDPVVVQHKLQLDDLEKYFRYKCIAELEQELQTEPTEEEIQSCVEENIGEFLQIISKAVEPEPTPSPTPSPSESP